MAWYHRLFNMARAGRHARDLDREFAFHLDEKVDALMAQGLSEPDARRAAARALGNRTLQTERTRDMDIVPWLESVLGDLRYAARALARTPGFALVAILSLALGIGANTAIFSLVNAVLLRTLPVERPRELMQVVMRDPESPEGDGNAVFTNPIWEQLRDRSGALAGALAWSSGTFNLADGGEVRLARSVWASGDYFRVLGVTAEAGRLFDAGDDRRGCAPTAVLSYGFWQQEYAGSRDAIGRAITLNGMPFTILGVTRQGFTGLEVGEASQVYVPLCAQDALRGERSYLDRRSTWWLNVLARVPDSLSVDQVRARLGAEAAGIFEATAPGNWSAEDLVSYRRTTFDLTAAPGGVSGVRDEYQQALLVLMVVVGVVLLIACANIANLLLARAAAREREIAVRLAIGAGRGRLVRQLLTESLLLSLIGAGLGVVFAGWASRLLVRLLSSNSGAVWLDLTLDGRVLAFSMGVGVLTGVLFGLAPAWRSARVSPQAAMKAGGHGLMDATARLTTGKLLVVGQVALSLVLVAAAGLLVGTFHRLSVLDPGFRRDGVLLTSVDAAKAGATEDQRATRLRETLERYRSVPGVQAAAMAALVPIGGTSWNSEIQVDGYTSTSRMDAVVWFNAVSDGYFAAMGQPLVAGRDFTSQDRAGAPRVAIVDEAVARKFFAGQNPIGRTVRTVMPDSLGPPVEIVGVVRAAKYRSLRDGDADAATIFLPIAQEGFFGTQAEFVIRSALDPAALVPAINAASREVHPALSLTHTTFAAQVARSLRRARMLALLSGFFGALALLLAVIGLYGTMAYGVTKRRREIGIRLALGAAHGAVVRMLAGEVGRLVVIGLLIGIGLTLLATRMVGTFLYGVTARDPRTLGVAAGVLLVTALAAGVIPAWRSVRQDPTTTLREE